MVTAGNDRGSPGPLRVLLIDGDGSDRALFARATESSGVEVCLSTVGSGDEAVEYLGGLGRYADRSLHPMPELMVLELKLAGVSGLELLEWKRGTAVRDVPAVVFTGFAQRRDLEVARSLGAVECVRKPLDFHEFMGAVKRIVEFGFKERMAGERP